MKREDIDRIAASLEGIKCKTAKEVEELRVRLLGKKGEITALFDEFRTIDKAQKAEFGKVLNELKQKAQARIEELKGTVGDEGTDGAPRQDLSMPGDPYPLGSRHPVSIVRQEIVDIF
ncbi:MAG: phenylalanine--tRNA ligase subunit alpha, partial [Bacteroidales bacterium]|nr:phenylalanine--tRNA ligase subunit alpha [Bacteroidales bacterium]